MWIAQLTWRGRNVAEGKGEPDGFRGRTGNLPGRFDMSRAIKKVGVTQLTPGECEGNIVEGNKPPASRSSHGEPRIDADIYTSENSMKFPRLTRCELELMDVLWQKG